MSNLVPSLSVPARVAVGFLVAALCASSVRAQFVGTAVPNLSSPSGVAVDASNNVYITDPGNYTIAMYVPSAGTLTTLAGSPGNFGADPGTGAAASFFIPQGIVYARGGLVVADQGSQLIRFVTLTGTVSDIAGQAFTNGFANGNGTAATFSYPTGIAADGAGNLYVADSQNNAIREIDVNNNVTTMTTGGYLFNRPNAVAVDANNNVWVADSGHNNIVLLSNGVATVMAGSVTGQAGTNDSLVALNARFRNPSGLYWATNLNVLYIADTGNETVRSLFATNFNGASGFGVQTEAGLPGKAGFVNGSLSVAEFNQPIGLAADAAEFGIYVADNLNNAIRVLQPTAPEAPVTAPVIGYVSFPANANPANTSVFVPATSAVFNNLTNIAIEAEAGTETYVTFGPTGTSIPTPGPGSDTPPAYPGDGNVASAISSAIQPNPGTNDITVYAISVQQGRQSSTISSARFQFITANPAIIGNNAADIELLDATVGASLYYTIDGTTPTNNGASLGPVTTGAILSLTITTNVELQVRAFSVGLATSQVVSNARSVANVVGNQLSLGFSSGLGSSRMITAENLTFSAPITYTEIPSTLPIYTLQFDAVVTNAPGYANPAPKLDPTNFVGYLLQPDPAPPQFAPLPPAIYDFVAGKTNAGVSATQPSALEVVWLVTPPVTNLYTSPNLVEYSGTDETLFTVEMTGALLGAVQFLIPSNAVPGTPYLLQEEFASASSYNEPLCCGPPINVLIQTPTNGALTGSSPNAIKLVTVLTNNSPESSHLVGDVFPYTWYNIGDFGDGVLLNDDVIQTMEGAIKYAYTAYPTNVPLYDAMDSSDGTINSFYQDSDSAINIITNGDGYIDISDVYVTLRRSLDPTLTNYIRTWTGSNWYASVYTNTVQLGAKTSPGKLMTGGARYITIGADRVQTYGSLGAQVPVRVLAADAVYPIRVALLNVEILPLDGSPAVSTSISFSSSTNLGSPYATLSKAVNNYAGAWLNSEVTGVAGNNVLGTLNVVLPPSVTANSAYLVKIDTFSASPNGFSLFKSSTQNGLITVGNRNGSSWNDGIPDWWRLLYFGTVSNSMSAASLDPDGDGANNWQEYIAGTDPLNPASVFKFAASASPVAGVFTLQWPSVVNKSYTLESTQTPGRDWSVIASDLIGNGQVMQWTDTNAAATRFYRATVH